MFLPFLQLYNAASSLGILVCRPFFLLIGCTIDVNLPDISDVFQM